MQAGIKINPYQQTSADTKWTPFRRQRFQMHFLELSCLNFV